MDSGLQCNFTSLKVFCLLSFQLQRWSIYRFYEAAWQPGQRLQKNPVNKRATLITICSQWPQKPVLWNKAWFRVSGSLELEQPSGLGHSLSISIVSSPPLLCNLSVLSYWKCKFLNPVLAQLWRVLTLTIRAAVLLVKCCSILDCPFSWGCLCLPTITYNYPFKDSLIGFSHKQESGDLK